MNMDVDDDRRIYRFSQVITGGQYDVDVELLSPTKEILYRQIKSQFDSHQFTAAVCSKFFVLKLQLIYQ